MEGQNGDQMFFLCWKWSCVNATWKSCFCPVFTMPFLRCCSFLWDVSFTACLLDFLLFILATALAVCWGWWLSAWCHCWLYICCWDTVILWRSIMWSDLGKLTLWKFLHNALVSIIGVCILLRIDWYLLFALFRQNIVWNKMCFMSHDWKALFPK